MSRAEKDRRYRVKHGEEKAAQHKLWRSKNKERLAERGAKRRLEKRAACLVAGARTRAKNKGLTFDLDPHIPWIQGVIDAGACSLSGIPFDLSPGRKPTSPSLDRIDPAKGYTRDNIRVICHALNAALGDWGEEKLRPIMLGWLTANERPLTKPLG